MAAPHVQRFPWILTAIIGAISGISYITAIIYNGALTVTALAASGLAGACAMAVNTFLAAYFQPDAEAEGIRRSGTKEAAATAIGYLMGAAVPLIGAALLTEAPAAAVYLSAGAAVMAALALLGWAGAAVGRVAAGRAAITVVICCCVSVATQSAACTNLCNA